MTSRIIVYLILIGLVALLGYFGYAIGVRRLFWLCMVGIVFLGYHFFRGIERQE